MSDSRFRGTGVAMVTPFNSRKEIDFNALEKIINHLINGKVDYLVTQGTTGEPATLSKEEKKELTKFTIKTIAGRVPLVLGIGGNNTAEMIHTLENTDFTGIDAILSVNPYYSRPNPNGVFHHYQAVAAVAPRPIILYNVPSRTGSNMSAELTLRIAHSSDKFIAIKEASCDVIQCMKIIRDKPKDFLVISGDDSFTLPLIGIGLDGVISVAAHADPLNFSDMVRAALANDYSKARELHYKLLDMMTAIFEEGSPGGIKAILHSKGLCENEVRLPLWNVSDALYERLKKM